MARYSDCISNWHEMEQFVAWRSRAARAVDRFTGLARRIMAMPDGKRKDELLSMLGSSEIPGSPWHYYDWLHERASSTDAWLWLPRSSRDRVLVFEGQLARIGRAAGASGLGDASASTRAAAVVGIVGLVGLAGLVFLGKTSPATGPRAFA